MSEHRSERQRARSAAMPAMSGVPAKTRSVFVGCGCGVPAKTHSVFVGCICVRAKSGAKL
jgi:hypothetical protein